MLKAIHTKSLGRGLSYLNLCAILSQMGSHQKALKYASIALVEIIHQLNKLTTGKKHGKKSKNKTKKFLENAKLLSIAHYNCGAE